MAKPIIGLLCVAVLAFGGKWYGARGEVDGLRRRLEELEKRGPKQTGARPASGEANGVRVAGLTEEQQAAVMLAAIARAGQEDDELARARREIVMLRRRLERGESATGRERKARRESSDERARLLRENQQLLVRCAELEQNCTGLVAKILEMQAAADRRSTPALRRF